MKQPKLDTRPARADMTSREVVRILGSLIGGLSGLVPNKQVLRDAVTWLAMSEEFWAGFEVVAAMSESNARKASDLIHCDPKKSS